MRTARSCVVCNKSIEGKSTSINAATTQFLSEIVGRTLTDKKLHTDLICKSCNQSCVEYDAMKIKIQKIKADLTDKFKTTLDELSMDMNTYPQKIMVLQQKSPTKEIKRLVLSASKLQPLPPDLMVNVSKFASALSPQKNMSQYVIPSKSLSPIKVETIASTASKNKTQPNMKLDKIETTINNTLAAILNPSTNEPNVMGFRSVDDKQDVKEEEELVGEEIQNEEQTMEIDEDCTLIHVTSDDKSTNEENDQTESQEKFYDLSLLPTDGAKGSNTHNIIENLQILDQGGDDDDNEETIVMTGENGSILRIMSGQKLVYENGEITLASDDENSQQGDNNDGHGEMSVKMARRRRRESNEESQIELQVSGDEETANAIIAAAQESGGAFIKVESGEMFRVQSVHSKPSTYVMQMVEHDEEGFKCLLCENKPDKDPLSETYYDAENIMLHMKEAHYARVYICQLCNKIFSRRAEYYTHTNDVHGSTTGKLVIDNEKVKLHECTQCKKKYNSRTLLAEHMNRHSGARPYSCATCGKTFASKYTHQAHLNTHRERPRPFKCKECPKTFLTQQNLNQHEKTHLGIKDFVCKICGKAFGTQHNLEVHGVVHSGERPFVCDDCGKAFARKAELRNHVRIHTGERPFSCDICGAAFSQRSNLHSHRRATHLDDRRHACPHTHCGKKFKRRRLLEYHIKASHTGERPLRCEVCSATFVYPEHYKKHVRIHSGLKPYVCEVCGKSFNSRDNRNTHRFVHSDKKPYECLVCGAGYMRKQLLYAHMNTSGHLAESIVVNQPRVHKVKAAGSNVQTETFVFDGGEAADSNIDQNLVHDGATVVESDGTPKLILTEDKKLIIQDGNSTINLVQESDDPAFLSLIQNLEGGKVSSGDVEGIGAEHLVQPQVQMVTTDENGEIRLVQLQINTNPATWSLHQE